MVSNSGSSSNHARMAYHERLVSHHKLTAEVANAMVDQYNYGEHRGRIPAEVADEHVAAGRHLTARNNVTRPT